MNDINLLPEDLREEDARQGNQAPSLGPKPTWHLPDSLNESQRGSGSNNKPGDAIQPSSLPKKPAGSVVSVKPAGKSEMDLKPLVPIFDLDAEAGSTERSAELTRGLAEVKKSALPDELSGPTPVQPAMPVVTGNQQILAKQDKSKGNGLLSRLFAKKEAKGRIIKNQLDKKTPPPNGVGKNVNVNLIPEGADLLPNRHFYSYFIYAGLGGLTLTGLLFLGLVFYQQKISGQEQAISAKVNESEMVYNQLKVKEESLSAWSKKVSAIQVLLDNHVYWTNFFANLQQVTSPDVYYKDISTAVDGTVTLSAAADSYLAVAKQYLAYQQAGQIIKEVKIGNVAGDSSAGEINFNVTLQFYPEVFFLAVNGN